MKERYIFLLRHCQTQLSDKKRLIGQYDVPLSQEGIALSHRIGEILKKNQLHHVLCSDLKRSKKTAEIIASYINHKPQSLKELNEISLGRWDGMYIDDIRNKYPIEYDQRGKDLINYKISGGENFIELQERAKTIFKEIQKKEGNILIVGHSGFNRALLCELLKIPINRLLTIKQNYGCCNIVVEKNKGYYIKLINGNLNI